MKPRAMLAIVTVTAAALAGCAGAPPPAPAVVPSPGRVLVFRLRPGQDLAREIQRVARDEAIEAGVVLTCVGSLKRTALRLANQPAATELDGFREIVSLTGLVTKDGAHLHLAASDAAGATIGGHLLDGSLVYTTAEIAILDVAAVRFTREPDPREQGGSGYHELVVRPR